MPRWIEIAIPVACIVVVIAAAAAFLYLLVTICIICAPFHGLHP